MSFPESLLRNHLLLLLHLLGGEGGGSYSQSDLGLVLT